MPDDPWTGGDERSISLPLREHTPLTPAEAGLAVTEAQRPWRRIAVAAVVVAAVAVPLVLVLGRGTSDRLLDLSTGTCFRPEVTDLSTAVDDVACEVGAVRFVGTVESGAGVDEPYPGEGALELLGQGGCPTIERDALVVAVPGPADWADGERTVACTERL